MSVLFFSEYVTASKGVFRFTGRTPSVLAANPNGNSSLPPQPSSVDAQKRVMIEPGKR